MSYLIIPEGYDPILNLQQTELGIQKIKDFFQANLSAELRLRRVTAPLFVLKGMGLNDDLSGKERAVNFPVKDMKEATAEVCEAFQGIKPILPSDIYFIHSEELLQKYPNLTPKEREREIAKEYGAVFIIGIGCVLSNGEKHDGRAPDYDDWSTPNTDGFLGLNGDIILWNPILELPFEISSMGIRVDKKSMEYQLMVEKKEDRKELYFHKRLLNNELPLAIGGGIGQSRLCMFLLHKAHIGEIQASIWPEEMINKCREHKIILI